jgi:hypothetical protein
MGEQGKRFVEQNRGALEQVLTLIDRLMTERARAAGDIGPNAGGGL